MLATYDQKWIKSFVEKLKIKWFRSSLIQQLKDAKASLGWTHNFSREQSSLIALLVCIETLGRIEGGERLVTIKTPLSQIKILQPTTNEEKSISLKIDSRFVPQLDSRKLSENGYILFVSSVSIIVSCLCTVKRCKIEPRSLEAFNCQKIILCLCASLKKTLTLNRI